MPASLHRDVRILKLLEALQKLQNHASALKKEARATASVEDNDTSDPLSKVLNSLERLSGLIDLCQPSQACRLFYMNAWVYAYLKRWVLSITNASDYQYLDDLMVTNQVLGGNGTLYLEAIADNDAPLKQLSKCIDSESCERTGLLERKSK